jgi:hypothetical protein
MLMLSASRSACLTGFKCRISMIALAAIALLPSAASAQDPRTGPQPDPASGVLVLPRLAELMISDPSDVVSDRSRKYARNVGWWTNGEQTTARLAKSVAEHLQAQGQRPSVVIVPFRSYPSWVGVSIAHAKAISESPRSRALKRAAGTNRLESVSANQQAIGRVNAHLAAAFVAAANRSIGNALKTTWSDVPVILVPTNPMTLPQTEAAAISAAKRGGRILGAADAPDAASIVASSIERFRRARAATASSVAGNSVPPPSSTAPEVSFQNSGDGRIAAFGKDGVTIFRAWDPKGVIKVLDGIDRIVPTVHVAQGERSLSLTYRYRNDTASPAQLCSIALPAFVLGDSITSQHFPEVGQDWQRSSSEGAWAATYPRDLYSPIAVIRNQKLAIGVSVKYPVLEYRHDVRLAIHPELGGEWRVVIGLENTGAHDSHSYLFNMPLMAPGEARTYQIDVTIGHPGAWLDTVASYRDYFRSRYGNVTYDRNLAPIAGVSLAMQHLQSQENPRGWVGEVGDPERQGFQSAADHIATRFSSADRVMVWTPTGLDASGSMSYPYKFTSQWSERVAGQVAPTSNAPELLRQVSSGAVQPRSLGLWWGRAANVESHWDDPSGDPLDPSKPDHLERAWRELDGAADAGATMVGLDAFAHCYSPVWNLVPFIQAAKQRYPTIKFCSEGRCCDILHREAPTWVDGYRYQPIVGQPERVARVRFDIAEYIVPGQETWVGMQFDRSRNPALWGPNSSSEAQRNEIADVARLGYVPVSWLPFDLRSIAGRR